MNWALLALLLLGAGCQRTPKGVVKEAELGVFFGGQVQELKELKKELDPGRQRHGFRLTFTEPLERDVRRVGNLSRGGPRWRSDSSPRKAQ